MSGRNRRALLLSEGYGEPFPEIQETGRFGKETGAVRFKEGARIVSTVPLRLPENWSLSFWLRDDRPEDMLSSEYHLDQVLNIRTRLLGLEHPWYFREDPDGRGREEGWEKGGNGDQWNRIHVPAFWAETHVGGYLGYGWYRTEFYVPGEYADMEHELHFEGVDEQGWVFVNGEYVGEQSVESTGRGLDDIWDEPFSVTVSPEHLEGGEKNLLVVLCHAGAGNAGLFSPACFIPPEGKDHEADLSGLSAERATPGRWEHYTLVSEGGESRLYINGVRADSVDRALWPHEVRDVSLEFIQSGPAAYIGILDDVRVYDGALSDSEVADLSPEMYHPEAPWLGEYGEDMRELIHAGMLLREEIDHLADLGAPDVEALIETLETADVKGDRLDAIWPLSVYGGYDGTAALIRALDAVSGTLLWSRKWEGPLTEDEDRGAHTAVVTCGEKVYGARAGGVCVFEASTGDKLSIWPVEGTPEKLLLTGGILIAQSPEGLTAFDAEEGTLMWRREMEGPWGALAADGQVYCLSSSREQDGRWHHELVAVELESGETAWKQPTESKGGHPQTTGLRLHFAGEGIVCLIEVDELRFLCAEDGSQLWQHETSATARPGRDSRMAGHFLVDGKVWIRDSNSKSYLAFEPQSGEILREAVRGGPPESNPSCQPVLGTSEFVFASSKAGTEVWNFDTGGAENVGFIRGGCQIGATIANGMAYTPPHACGCSAEWYYGSLAIVSSDDPGIETTQPGPLHRGAAYGEVNTAEEGVAPGAWPAYRRDGRRSAYLPQNISTEIKETWKKAADSGEAGDDGEWRLNFGRRISPPVAADGTVLLAVPQRHQVIALDAGSGEEKWRFTAAGRVSSPPTLYGEVVLFGAHDGYVYALRGADGELVWRRRAAPSDRRIMAYGQVESAWPVRNVLVHDGLAIAAAGRAADADGGAVVHGLRPESGEVRWSSRIEPYTARHGKPDLLVTDGEAVYLMNKRIDTETGEISEVSFGTKRRVREWSKASQPMVTYPEGVHYLRSGQAGFFETSWTGLDMGLRKHQSSWTWDESGGEIIAFSRHVGYAFQLDVGDDLWRVERGDPIGGGGKIEARARGEENPQWLHEIPAPAQVEAMLVSENALFAAGPKDRGNRMGDGGFLRIINREDGVTLTEIDLPAPPVHDGMAAAEGRVYVSLEDGHVLCLGDE